MTHHLKGTLFAKPPVSIRVGSERKIYYVHPEVLSSCSSPALNARVSGPWMNCGGGEIDWTDFDEQTIHCVLNFLYAGGYNVGHIAQTQTEKESVDTEEGKELSACENQSSKDELKIASIHEPLSPIDFCLENYLPVEHNRAKAETSCEKTDEDTMHELVLHAKVYLFAHRYLPDDLANLALRHLQPILVILGRQQLGFTQQLADAICLMYTGILTSEGREDPARKLLSHFVALKYTALYGDYLEDLLAEGGQFTIDVCRKLARRLMSNPLEEKLQELFVSNESLQADWTDKDREAKALTREL